MDLSLAAFEPLLKSLALADLPYLGTAVGAMLTPVAGPFGMLVAPAINLIVPKIAEALGQPADATPAQLAAAIDADPDAAKDKLAELNEQHQFALSADKQAQDFTLASQAQQVALNTVEVQNPSLFVGGWRPALAWALSALLVASFAIPYLVWFLRCIGLVIPDAPPLSLEAMGFLASILGVTVVARSVDKATGTAAPKIGGTSRVPTSALRK